MKLVFWLSSRFVLPALALAALLLVSCRGLESSAGPTASVSPAGSTPSTPPPATVFLTPTATTAITVPTPTPALPVTAPVCAKDGYTVSASAQGATGSVAISIRFKAKGEPCTVGEPLVVALFDRGGNPLLGIASNPATFPTGFVAGAEGVTRVVTWSNWCAAPGTFSASVAAGGPVVFVPIAAPPRCDAPSQKSALSLHP